MKKTNNILLVILLILVVGVVGLTLAYFSNTADVENTFTSKQYGTTVNEVFESPENWTPGTTTPKTLTVTNSGNVDEAVRISYTETWTSANSNTEGDLELSQGNNRAAIINFANSSDWTKVTENNKDYYYYNYKLAPGEVTSTLLDSVTFNSAIANSSNCTTSETATGKQVVCSSTGDGYDGATYKLVFTVETVQYDKYGEAWNTNASIAATKAVTVKGLKVNGADKTYETGDRKEMFAFNQPATSQTTAGTEYRYIGNTPNNYVKFNCDNDGTNCEIWRIIGVFNVDNGTGTYEQRIKLVRGSAFATTMAWDTKDGEWQGSGINEWNGADLEVFLNGDYLNRENTASTYGLKELAQSQIASAKYYLGGRAWQEGTNYGSTEDMYAWERGTTVYNQNNAVRSTSWTGTVGLLYPSDYGYTYSKGVDELCYSDPNQCYDHGVSSDLSGSGSNAYPTNGWIYNSNNLEGQSGTQWNWLLSPTADGSNFVFSVGSGGIVGNSNASGVGGVRPVVYLKSNIQITGGTGESTNPYTIG